MQVIDSIDSMRLASREVRRRCRRVGLVPTMGCLHDGHLSLIRKAREVSDFVVVSVFVNPTQFGPKEDFDAYPRDAVRDEDLCSREGVDVLFCPRTEEMYSPSSSVCVDETELSLGLCGKSRPGHFRGVVTVVAKLFNIVEPDVAVFGQKDAQQVRVVQQLVQDLNFAVEVVVAPIVREADGLAMSSRNIYLSPEERRRATCLYRAIRLAEKLCADGRRDTALIRDRMLEVLAEAGAADVEYVEIVDYQTLRPVPRIETPSLVALCARIGRTRLIDNTIITPC